MHEILNSVTLVREMLVKIVQQNRHFFRLDLQKRENRYHVLFFIYSYLHHECYQN